MIGNFIKVSFRNLNKYKSYSFISITGLVIGITSCLLIILFVTAELSYDKHQSKSDRIYRIWLERVYPGQTINWSTISPGVMPGLKNSLPEIEEGVRLVLNNGAVVKYGDKIFTEDRMFYADSTYGKVFDLKLMDGNAETALNSPYSMIINTTTAKKYFGSQDPIGKQVVVQDTILYSVTGVMVDMPSNSHFHPDIIVPMASLQFPAMDRWDSYFFFHSYILLKKNSDVNSFQKKLPAVVKANLFSGNAAPDAYNQWVASGNNYIFHLMPVTDIHFKSDMRNELEAGGNQSYVYILLAIAIFILFIACANFMNLATARSSGRAKEVGIRKVLGAFRKNLIAQFLLESILVSMVSMAVTLIVIEIILPFFNDLVGKQLSLYSIMNFKVGFLLLAFTVALGVMAGIYPAFYLSSFRPVVVLKGKLSGRIKNSFFRNSLVVMQFSISIILIIGTLVVYTQMNFMHNKKLGFNKEAVLLVHNARDLGSKSGAFKTELLKNSHVKNITSSGQIMGDITAASTFKLKENSEATNINTAILGVSENFFETMGIELIAGRNFRPDDFTDTTRYAIINETAAKIFGWNKDAPGHQLESTDNHPVFILGVVKDFNFESLHNEIRPMVIIPANDWLGVIEVKYSSANTGELIKDIEKTWNNFVPGHLFNYSFLDEDFRKLYESEKRTGAIFIIFSVLAILIGCLGLFGLSAFTAEQRTKEIGIRKVLGSTSANIVYILSRQFLKLVLISNLIAWPAAYYFMNKWLEDFAFRITPGLWIFLSAGITALIIALLTVSYQAVKTAIANPVKALKYE